jgi:hypothetical protein
MNNYVNNTGCWPYPEPGGSITTQCGSIQKSSSSSSSSSSPSNFTTLYIILGIIAFLVAAVFIIYAAVRK